MEKLYLIDASGFLYRSYHAIAPITNSRGESTNALFGFIRSVLKLFKDFSPEHVVAVFDGPKSIEKREAIYKEYKAHRVEMPGDLRYQMEWARKFCDLRGIPYLSVTGVEADDTMGSVAKWAEKQGAMVYMCTSDKDMAQLITDRTFILNTFKENLLIGPKQVEEIYGIKPEQMIDWLSITGDASDNVPGLPGFGPKTATALLQEFGTLDNILAHPEKVSGKKKQETLIQSADLARMSRQLVTIDTEVPFPPQKDFFSLKQPKMVELRAFYADMNFNSLLRELGDAPSSIEKGQETTEKATCTLVDDPDSFAALLKLLSQQKEVCVDTETTHLRPLKAQLVGIGLGWDEKQAYYIPVNGKLGLETVLHGLKPILESPQIGFYGHNLKYDYQVFGNYGIRIANICFDTMLASYLLNSHNRRHSLDDLTLECFGKTKIPISELIGKGKTQISMAEVALDKICTYCCEDVECTVKLKAFLNQQLEERKLTSLLFEIELPLLRVLADMERTGIFVDAHKLQVFGKEVTRRLAGLEHEIYALAGESFNINSPKQLSDILFVKMGIKPPRKTATGHSTDAEVLESLAENYPIANKMLEYRGLEKLRSTYIESLPEEIDPRTHRIHGTFNQSVAATGRLASQDPNLQNIPVRTDEGRKIRAAFRPQKEGWSYLSADYSQIELRLLAHLSEDPQLLYAFQHNEDVHAHTASVIFNVPLNEVTRQQRSQAKAVNFGVIYGQQAFGLARGLGISMKDAAGFIDMYFKRYSRVKGYVEESIAKARETGRAVTITGRERLIPEINSKNGTLRALAERLATNTPLQGTAADLIKKAMLQIDDELKRGHYHSMMILQIHDELLFEVPPEEISRLSAMVKDRMQNIWTLKVPLTVDIKIGKNWEEC